MSTYESYAEYYHVLTKYSPEGIAANQHRLDFNKQPAQSICDVYKLIEQFFLTRSSQGIWCQACCRISFQWPRAQKMIAATETVS